MRVTHEDLDHVRVLAAELTQSLLLLVHRVVLERGNETIELLLLVTLARLLHYNRAGQVLQEVGTEDCHGLGGVLTSERMVDSLLLVVEVLVILKFSNERLGFPICHLIESSNKGIIFSLGPLIDTESRECVLIVLLSGG